MKKNYQTPALGLVELTLEDVLTASTLSNGGNGQASVWNYNTGWKEDIYE